MTSFTPAGNDELVADDFQPTRPPQSRAGALVEVTRRRRARREWSGIARSVRTKILVSYLVLLVIAVFLSAFLIRELLESRLNDRIDANLQQEVDELDRLVADGRDPQTGRPFTTLSRLFQIYLERNVPSDEEAYATFIDGESYRSVLAKFPVARIPAETLGYWQVLSSRPSRDDGLTTGEFGTDAGTARFAVRRLRLTGDQDGAFAVTILPAAELKDIEEMQRYVFLAALGFMLIASAVAWVVAGRVLAPVRNLTETARTISQSDLTKRIEMRGGGEAADMARTFNAMLDRLETVFRTQQEFVQDASHELRDPLTICRGHLELLGDDPEERRLTTALVIDELDRMGRIVDDLQLLAEIEQPDFLRPEWIDAAVFAHEFAAKASALAPRDWLLDQAGEGMVLADRHRLTEAMINLAHNAVQHTNEDGTIAIGTSVDADEARFWVRDTGVGVPLSDQRRIFDRFTRGRSAYRRYRGGGLGLAIVRAIAEAHRGHVDLDSRLGAGSTFTIVIPHDGGGIASSGTDPDR